MILINTTLFAENFGSELTSLDDVFGLINGTQRLVQTCNVGVNYSTYIDVIVKKVIENSNATLDNNKIIIDSYDGIKYRTIKGNKHSIISFCLNYWSATV